MKIALFHPWNILGGWNAIGGYSETLRRMGHDVLLCHFPGNIVANVDEIRKTAPTIEQLNRCQVVLSLYHEYTQPWLAAIYGLENWKNLKVPVVAQFNESMCRGDLGLPGRMPELKKWANHFYFPAVQDAEEFGGTWMPFHIDTDMFGSCNHREPHYHANGKDICNGQEKKYNIGFIGTLYQSRKSYLEKLAAGAGNDLTFNCGNVIAQDLSGILPKESTELLAKNYGYIKIFFCLPPISRLVVEKVMEVMACGTFVMYPKLPGDAAKNLSTFEDGKEIVYYEPGFMANNVKQLRYYMEHEGEREKIARAGSDKIHRSFRLDQMFEKMFNAIK